MNKKGYKQLQVDRHKDPLDLTHPLDLTSHFVSVHSRHEHPFISTTMTLAGRRQVDDLPTPKEL